MEQENEEQSLISEDNSSGKPKKDWSFLSDMDTLISHMNSQKKLRCIVYDTETTGLSFKKDHILELACVEVVNFGLTGRNFHIYIKPRVFVTKKVQEINHIKYDDYKKYWEYYNLDTKAQLENLLEFIGEDSYLIAHNATFDYYFLNSELKYWGLPEIPSERFRCTLRMVKKLFKKENIEVPNNKLATCCEYFKILVNENEGSYHNALFDTIMTSKLLIHLYKKFAGINDYDLNKNSINNYNKYNNNNQKPRFNKFDQDNVNKIKEKTNNGKKEEKYENIKENNDNIIDNRTNNNVDIKINDNDKVKETQQNENNNEISQGKLNGVELNLLIKKMNEMIINEQNKESKKDE